MLSGTVVEETHSVVHLKLIFLPCAPLFALIRPFLFRAISSRRRPVYLARQRLTGVELILAEVLLLAAVLPQCVCVSDLSQLILLFLFSPAVLRHVVCR